MSKHVTKGHFPTAGKSSTRRKWRLADLVPKLIAKGDSQILGVGETAEREVAEASHRQAWFRIIYVFGLLIFAVGCLSVGLFLVYFPPSNPKSVVSAALAVDEFDETERKTLKALSTGEVFQEVYRDEIACAKKALDSWAGAPSGAGNVLNLSWEEDKAIPFFYSLQPEHRIFTSSSEFMGSYLDSNERLHFLYFTKSNINPEGSVSELLMLKQGKYELNWQLFIQNHYRVFNVFNTSRSIAPEAFYLTVKLRHTFKEDRIPDGMRTVPLFISGTNPNVWIEAFVATSSTAIELVDIVNWDKEQPIRASLRWWPSSANPAERFLFVDEIIAFDWNGALPFESPAESQ
ncbi:MAG: hypothetical protein R3F19_07175 [Verrucomicrobiales bacterium]